MKQKLKLISMSEIETEEVKWLWYPYIPVGKVTIVQSDPGEGTLPLAAKRGIRRPRGRRQAEHLSDVVGLGAPANRQFRAEARTHLSRAHFCGSAITASGGAASKGDQSPFEEPPALRGGFIRKELTMKQQNKSIRLTIRLTPEQYDSIRARAETAQMTPSAYVRAAAMRHKVVVVDGLKEMTHELKGLGRNLNQLVVLANMGRVKEVHLGEVFETLAKVYHKLQELAAQEKS